jgi:predicted  nucleic acid-binding Zn-ribbon protein
MAIRIPIISEFNPKGIAQAKAEFATLEGAGSKSMFLLQKAILPAAAAIGTFTSVIAPAIKAASDFEESAAKVDVIFGQASKSVKDFASTAAVSLGQSKQDVLNAAGVFGTFGKAAGLAGEDLGLFTTDFVTLATDLASFNNSTPEEAVMALGAALRGESEPLRRYGILLDDATLKAEATRLGIYKGNKALTSQQKILAAQSAIYKQSGDAQGDFARTSDGLANSQRTLTALFKNLQIELGQKLLPVTTDFVNALIDIKGALDDIPEPAKTATQKISDFVNKVTNSINPLYQFYKAITFIGNQLNKTEKDLDPYSQKLNYGTAQTIRMADASDELKNKLKEEEETFGGVTKEVESFAGALKDKLSEAVDTAKEKLADAKAEFTDFATSVSDAVMGALDFNKALEDGKYGFAGFLDSLRKQVKGVEDYGTNLQTALAMNLSEDALGFVLDAGSEAGAKIASELVKGGQAAIDETNALVESAQAAADKVGLNAATKWYQSGVDSAQKMVDGLVAELDLMTPKLMKKMDEIASKMKRKVNIDVVITERVNKIVATVSGGIPQMAEGGIVNRPTLALIGEAGPEAVVPLSKMGGMGGGGDININVNGGMATSAEIGQSILNALRAYQRSAGPLNLNIA